MLVALLLLYEHSGIWALAVRFRLTVRQAANQLHAFFRLVASFLSSAVPRRSSATFWTVPAVVLLIIITFCGILLDLLASRSMLSRLLASA